MNDNVHTLSWPVIFFITFLFWPIGIYLILKKVSLDRQAAMVGSKLIKIFGIILFSFALLGFIISVEEGFDAGSLIVILFFGAAGLSLMGTSTKMKHNAEDIRRYLAIVVNGGKRNLEEIASAVKKPYETARNDLQAMIDKGYLKGAYIDDGRGELVLTERQQPVVQMAPPLFAGTPTRPPVQQKKMVLQCVCCGANNVIEGDVGICEYCGSPIGKR